MISFLGGRRQRSWGRIALVLIVVLAGLLLDQSDGCLLKMKKKPEMDASVQEAVREICWIDSNGRLRCKPVHWLQKDIDNMDQYGQLPSDEFKKTAVDMFVPRESGETRKEGQVDDFNLEKDVEKAPASPPIKSTDIDRSCHCDVCRKISSRRDNVLIAIEFFNFAPIYCGCPGGSDAPEGIESDGKESSNLSSELSTAAAEDAANHCGENEVTCFKLGYPGVNDQNCSFITRRFTSVDEESAINLNCQSIHDSNITLTFTEIYNSSINISFRSLSNSSVVIGFSSISNSNVVINLSSIHKTNLSLNYESIKSSSPSSKIVAIADSSIKIKFGNISSSSLGPELRAVNNSSIVLSFRRHEESYLPSSKYASLDRAIVNEWI